MVDEDVEDEVRDVQNAEEHAELESEESDTLQQMDEEESAHFFAMKWLNQDGSDKDIPKQYAPCKYYFNAKRGCLNYQCEFSHNEELFRKEPFKRWLKKLCWDRNHQRSGRSGAKYTFQEQNTWKNKTKKHHQEW